MFWISGPRVRPLRALYLSAFVVLAILALPVQAEVRLPNGEWVASAEDLRVKVLGGYVVAQRTWQADRVRRGEYRWHLNPAWDDLRFDLDELDDSIQVVRRAGARFVRTGDSEALYVFDKQFFIREEVEAGVRTGWRWYDRKGNWISYDAEGKITAYGDRNNIRVHFTRDTQGRLHQVLDHHQNVALTYTYNGNTTVLTDRAGRSVEYHYSNGRITQVIDVLGNPSTYTYSGGLMTAMTDAEGRQTQIAYSGNRVVRVTHPADPGEAAAITEYEYDYNRVERRYRIIEHRRLADGSPRQVIRTQTFDANGKLLRSDTGTGRTTFRLERDGHHIEHRIDERGLRTTTEYDAHRNPIRIRYPDGSQVHMAYEPVHNQLIERTDELGVKTAYTYDATGNLLTMTEAVDLLDEQRITTYTYDSHGRRETYTIKGATAADDATTAWTYDAHGNVETETNPENETTTYGSYHVTGQPGTRTDARQHTTTFVYDDAGRLIAVTNSLNHTVAFEYDKVGNRTKSIDAKDNETGYTYTARNWPKTETDAEGGVTTYDYDRDGNRIKETDADGVETRYDYDLDQRLWRVIDGANNVTEYVYGTTQVGTPGELHQTIYPTYREEYRYDQRGRRTQTIRILPAANGEPEQRQITVTSYDSRGRVQSVTDPMQRTTVNSYDALGRLRTATDAAGGITGYGYDVRDNLTSVTDANSNTHTFQYDKADRMTREARPLGQGIDYDYDEVGHLIQRTSANGERREYVYDAANRRTHEHHYPTGETEASQSIVYHYDERSLLTGYTQTGDTDSAAVYVYNDRGDKTTETVTYGQGATAFSRTIRYDHHANRLPESFTYPDGTRINYSYDLANRLSQITTPAGPIDYAAYQWQQPTRVELPGAVRTHAYDGFQRPKRITVQALGTGSHQSPNGDTHLDLHYTYNAAGNITQKASQDGPYLYDYDALNRLTQAIPPEPLQASIENPGGLPIESYAYDPVHNRIQSQHQPGAWQYNPNNELLGWGLGADQVSYQYDANGHTIQETKAGEITQYLYNAAERLSEVRRNGATIATYQYDPLGRRIKKDVQGQITWFQYSEEGLVAEYGATGTLTRTYGWYPQGLWGTDPVFLADVSTVGATTHWQIHHYHNDHLGTPQRLTGADGTLSWQAIAEAFGKTTPTPNNLIENPLRFPGQYEEFREQYYNFNRDYRPGLGRYYSVDVLGLFAGINYYLYANAGPLRYLDPKGLSSTEPCDCDGEVGDEAPWLGGHFGGSGTALLFNFGAEVGAFLNTFTGESCVVKKFCGGPALGFGLSGSAEFEAKLVGPYCGKDLGGFTCEITMDGVIGTGGGGAIGLPGSCGGLSASGAVGSGIGAHVSVAFRFCWTTVKGCWNTPCECQ